MLHTFINTGDPRRLFQRRLLAHSFISVGLTGVSNYYFISFEELIWFQRNGGQIRIWKDVLVPAANLQLLTEPDLLQHLQRYADSRS